MTARRGLVPAEHQIVEICVAVANLGIITRAPNVFLDAEVLLPKLVDQARKRPKQTFFRGSSQGAKALGVGLILIKDGRQTRIPMAQRLLFCVRNIA